MVELDLVSMGFALGLGLLAIGLSAWQRLGLEWNLVVATVRMIVQLLAVGCLLEIVFALPSPWTGIGLVAVMVGITAVVVGNRISKKIPQILPIVGGAVGLGTALTLAYVNLLVLRLETWYEPQYLVPLTGILTGNALNAAAIAGERFVNTLNNSQLELETHLSLGATPRQATVQYRREAIKAGLMPTLNSMLLVGIVTLPGVLTGQLLGGVAPLNAALYQIVIMLLLVTATLITSIALIQGIDRQFFTDAAQLRKF